MIFYFTGTGNSLYAAANIARAQGEKPISIARELDEAKEKYKIAMQEGDLLGFVYPVYAWGPPKIVLDFIKRLEITGGKPYVFSVSTCGDEEGNTTKILQKALSKKGLTLQSAFTIKMPNNYIIGFEVDSKESEGEKLKLADEKLERINAVIKSRQTGARNIYPGNSPGVKSALANPMFNRFALNADKFYATNACTACGTCVTACPIHTITLVNQKPQWKKACTQCLGCINICPTHAIQYGQNTANRGRYLHPDYHKLKTL